MEKELNIAAILKDKPKGTKLWSDTFGKAELWRVSEDNYPIKIAILNGNVIDLTKEGKYFKDIEDCLPCIVPSKSMRDWSKFAWKRGDVLTDEERFVIFKCFKDDDYTEFSASFAYEDNAFRRNLGLIVDDFRKVSDIVAQEVIKRIEEHYGGKLNLSTLEIEKPQFKDGDMVTIHKKDCDITFIFNRMKTKDSFYYYAFHTYNENNTGIIDERISLPYEWTYIDGKISPATDSEKQQLFSALAKENKAWDTEKKQIVNLPKKCEFKPFDKVLVRNYDSWKWRINLFSHYDTETQFKYACLSGNFLQCIPYNDQTDHLLGTTDDWKGGEA